jgi:SAM-dependent methyltransferase
MTWGLWRVPESELRLLGDLRGKDVLELGCGAARWSIALAQKGARPVGLDLSVSQLAKATRLVRRARVDVPLVRASAEAIPFRAGSFDTVFCDWGAMTFCDPLRTVPGCARVLRPGGQLVFATASPIRMLAHDRRSDRQSLRLRRPYFGMHRLELGTTVEFQMPYGEWIGLFAENDLDVVRLVETRPRPGPGTAYLNRNDARWALRWPMETIWKLRKRSR